MEVYLYSIIYIPIFALFGWLVSRIVGDASVADIFWGLGFVGLGWLSWSIERGSIMIPILITLWGIRLALHIGIRNYSKGPDFRYEKMRKQNPSTWWWWSFFKVFLLQAMLLLVIGLVVIEGASQHTSPTKHIVFIAIGIAIAIVGLLYESLADYQLVRFKSLRRQGATKEGSILDTGLWKYSRHPNYFGEFVFWWGVFLTTISISNSYWTVISPLLISFLLLKVSGVTMLEKGMLERRPAYADYTAETPSFFPRFRN